MSPEGAVIKGNIMAVTQKSVNLFTTPNFALFYYAVFAKRVHPIGVWAGTIVGSVVAILVAFSGQLCYFLHVNFQFDPATVGAPVESKLNALTGIPYEACVDPISFQWIGLFALVANLLVGISLNYLLTDAPRAKIIVSDQVESEESSDV